jgi:DnaJ-like protein
MAPFLLGAVLLILILLLLRAFAFADPKLLIKSLRYVGATVFGAFALLLAFGGRWAPAMVLGSMAWGLATRGHPWPQGWPPFFGGHSSRSRTKENETTSVRTAWVEMELDHDTGAMHGTVLKGTHTGKTLDSLARGTLLAFYLEAATADAETARLLEAYMDRTLDADWRADAERQRSPSQAGSAMSREEALKILGLQEGATEVQIRAAHRRLMMQNHPDRGGSDYIAAKINEAKDVLLGR